MIIHTCICIVYIYIIIIYMIYEALYGTIIDEGYHNDANGIIGMRVRLDAVVFVFMSDDTESNHYIS